MKVTGIRALRIVMTDFYGGIFTNTESTEKKYLKQMPETLATVIAYLDLKV